MILDVSAETLVEEGGKTNGGIVEHAALVVAVVSEVDVGGGNGKSRRRVDAVG